MKKSIKKQSSKSKLINDKKKIIIASVLMSIAAIIYTVIVFSSLNSLHGCGSAGFEGTLELNRVFYLSVMALPFLLCVFAEIQILKLKTKSLSFLLSILNIILVVAPAAVVIIVTAQAFDYFSSIYLFDSPYCW